MALAPVPMTATRLPVMSTAWSHCAEWNDGAREFVDARDVGDQRDVQRARPRDEELGDVLLAVGGEHVPPHLGVVPVRAVDERVEADVPAQAVLLGDALEVVEDLRLQGPHVGPVGLRLEGEGIHVRRDVAGAAGVGVVTPGAADVVGLLEDHEVVDRSPASAARCPCRGRRSRCR